jgi:hypothetical protein
MNRKGMAWVYVKQPKKISPSEKESLLKRIEVEIAKTTKLRKTVSRIEIKSGRVYMYHLFEPSQPEGVIFTVPLIDGKYIELPYARITMYASIDDNCSLDWQRHNNQWMTISEGSLEECIQEAEQSEWFE